jgi:hypothetical protein
MVLFVDDNDLQGAFEGLYNYGFGSAEEPGPFRPYGQGRVEGFQAAPNPLLPTRTRRSARSPIHRRWFGAYLSLLADRGVCDHHADPAGPPSNASALEYDPFRGPPPSHLPFGGWSLMQADASLSSATTCRSWGWVLRRGDKAFSILQDRGYAGSCKRTSENSPSRDRLESPDRPRFGV